MSERTYYVLCDDNCKFESLTKEQILSAIYQGVTSGNIDVADGFITKIKEINHNNDIQFWVGTQAEYNAIEQREENTLYIISDDTSKDEIFADIEYLMNEIEGIQTAITNATEDIDVINYELNAISSDTSNLESSISGIESDISTIASNVESLEDDLSALDTVRQQINEGGQVVLYENFNASFTSQLQSFTLSENHSNYNKIIVKITMKDSDDISNWVTSTQTYYPSVMNGINFVMSLHKSLSGIPSYVNLYFQGNKLNERYHSSDLVNVDFDIKIIGVI